MNLSGKIFEPELYNYNDYKLWEGNWELLHGYPQAMSPSPNRVHQAFAGNFFAAIKTALKQNTVACNCNAYYELDWIINDNTVVRPDCMVVCGQFTEDYLTYPPSLILEVSSHSTRIKDGNTKFDLYQMYGVKYYIIADTEKKTIEIFDLIDNIYKQKDSGNFILSAACSFYIDMELLWE